MAVHAVEINSEISVLREFLLRVRCRSAKWVGYLVEKWAAGKITARVFTDQWPEFTCVIVIYCNWIPSDCSGIALDTTLLDDTELISTAGERENIVRVLQKNGVINWKRRCMIVDDFPQGISESIVDSVHHPLGREHGHVDYELSVKRHSFVGGIEPLETRKLPEGFYCQQLEPSHAEYIAKYWGFWVKTSVAIVARFIHCITHGVSVGVFTRNEPHRLVSWAVQDAYGRSIHHLYTLEEYRRRGLASTVVKEMCRKILDEGEEPYAMIAIGNNRSETLFKKLGFVEGKDVLCFLKHIKAI